MITLANRLMVGAQPTPLEYLGHVYGGGIRTTLDISSLGIQEGDILFSSSQQYLASTPGIAAPRVTFWTETYSLPFNNTVYYGAYSHRFTATGPMTSIGITQATFASADICIYAFRPSKSYSFVNDQNRASNRTPFSVTTTKNNSLVLLLGFDDRSTGDINEFNAPNSPAGFTAIGPNGGTCLYAAYKFIPTPTLVSPNDFYVLGSSALHAYYTSTLLIEPTA